MRSDTKIWRTQQRCLVYLKEGVSVLAMPTAGVWLPIRGAQNLFTEVFANIIFVFAIPITPVPTAWYMILFFKTCPNYDFINII